MPEVLGGALNVLKTALGFFLKKTGPTLCLGNGGVIAQRGKLERSSSSLGKQIEIAIFPQIADDGRKNRTEKTVFKRREFVSSLEMFSKDEGEVDDDDESAWV